MVTGLRFDGAGNGEWKYTYSNSELGTITLDNALSIANLSTAPCLIRRILALPPSTARARRRAPPLGYSVGGGSPSTTNPRRADADVVFSCNGTLEAFAMAAKLPAVRLAWQEGSFII
jgi:hypothetical protein